MSTAAKRPPALPRRRAATKAAAKNGQAPRKSRQRRFDSPQQQAYLNLWRTYDRLRTLEDELFARHDLTAQQYNALRLLRAAYPDPVATLTLAGRLISRAPDITRLVDKLTERGLVARDRRPENRRVVEVSITAAGLALLDRLAAEVRECHERQLGHLKAGELKQLVALLHKARGPHEEQGSIWST
ncbi:MAG: MarR family transcriptional regulator [Pirellulales bacterium]|nr:MarR family transcriptional regulator [Pirellulales bacterium]